MGRIILGAIVGFLAWSVIWVGSEMLMSAMWPDSYGAHQAAFQEAVTNGGDFIPDSTMLALNVVRGALLAILAGFLAVVIARENKRTPIILGVLLIAFCVMVMSMAKSYIPLWYTIAFAIIFIPMTMIGGKMKKFA